MVTNVVTNLSALAENYGNKERQRTHMQLQKMPKFCQFAVQILIHGIKALLQLLFCKLANGVVRRIVVDVRQEDRLRERRLDMLP